MLTKLPTGKSDEPQFQLFLPDVLVKFVTSRFQHDAGFLAQFRERTVDRHDLAIAWMLKPRLLEAMATLLF